jgi:hypothetical protein
MKTAGIVGGGPAGLAAARFLQDAGWRATVFEAQDRPGGKCHSFVRDGGFNEMGTCYTTLAHKTIKAWMAEEGVRLRPLGTALFDDVRVIDYVKQGGGGSLLQEASRFWNDRSRLKKRLHAAPCDRNVKQEAAMSTRDWLQARGLTKIERAMLRTQVVQGYGFLDETSIAQTIGWCNLDLLISGALNKMDMPVEGWSEFWSRFAKRLDVRYGHRIAGIERGKSHDKPALTDTHGVRHAFDTIIITAPLDEISACFDLTGEERFIRDAIEWQSYTTSLISSNNWFKGPQVKAYSEGCLDAGRRGMMLGGRAEGFDEGLGGSLYVTGQLTGAYTQAELRELLQASAARRGFDIDAVIYQKTWKYFPQYRREAVAEGLYEKLRSVQGKGEVWYSGSSFSHELVSSVVAQSAQVVRQMTARVYA